VSLENEINSISGRMLKSGLVEHDDITNAKPKEKNDM